MDDKLKEENIYNIISLFDNPEREGLQDTPRRHLKFLKEFCAKPDFNFTTFDSEGMDEMIIETGIPFYSLCEHHLLPFFGMGHIAYIPDKKIAGLSKLARCLDYHAAGFQNQERITQNVAKYLREKLETVNVAVVIKARHMCMEMRGVKKHDTYTVTSKMLGCFTTGAPRQEFLNLIK